MPRDDLRFVQSVTRGDRTRQGSSFYSPNSAASGLSSSTRCEMTFTMTIRGMASSRPHTPHTHAQKSSEIKTAVVFILATFPVITVTTNIPTTVAITTELPDTNNAIQIELKYMNPAIPVATAIRRGPK